MEEENNERIVTVRERNWNQFFEEATDCFENGFAPSTILQKHELKYGVTTIISLLKINHETPTVIGNHMMENTSFNMIFGREIVPRLETNHNKRNVLLIGIGVLNEILTQWNNLESPMHIAYILDQPKVMMKIPALNEFVHYKPDVNKYVSLNQH